MCTHDVCCDRCPVSDAVTRCTTSTAGPIRNERVIPQIKNNKKRPQNSRDFFYKKKGFPFSLTSTWTPRLSMNTVTSVTLKIVN